MSRYNRDRNIGQENENSNQVNMYPPRRGGYMVNKYPHSSSPPQKFPPPRRHPPRDRQPNTRPPVRNFHPPRNFPKPPKNLPPPKKTVHFEETLEEDSSEEDFEENKKKFLGRRTTFLDTEEDTKELRVFEQQQLSKCKSAYTKTQKFIAWFKGSVLMLISILLLIHFFIFLKGWLQPSCYSDVQSLRIDYIHDQLYSLRHNLIVEIDNTRQAIIDRGFCPFKIFDICSNLPLQNESNCVDYRVGFDLDCFCTGREIFPKHGVWYVNDWKNDGYNQTDLDFFCNGELWRPHFNNLFTNVSNEFGDIMVTEVFYAEDDIKHFTYPARKNYAIWQTTTDGYICTALGVVCLMEDNPSEVNWFKAHKNVPTDFCIVLDRSMAQWSVLYYEGAHVNTWDGDAALIPVILENIFPTNRICAIEFDENKIEVFHKYKGKSPFLYSTTWNRLNITQFFANFTDDLQPQTSDLSDNITVVLQFAEKVLRDNDRLTENRKIILITHTEVTKNITFRPSYGPRIEYHHICTACSANSQKIFQDWANTHPDMTFVGYMYYIWKPQMLTYIEPFCHDFSKEIVDGKFIWIDEIDDFYGRAKKHTEMMYSTIGVNTPQTTGVLGFNFIAELFYEEENMHKEQDMILDISRKVDNIVALIFLQIWSIVDLIIVYNVGLALIFCFYFIFKFVIKEEMMYWSFCIIALSFTYLLQRIFNLYIEPWIVGQRLFLDIYEGTFDLDGFFSILLTLFIGVYYLILLLLSCGLIGAFGNKEKLTAAAKRGTVSGKLHTMTMGLDIRDYYIMIEKGGSRYIGNVPRLVINPGKLIAILGHSGSGKSQFFNYLLGEQLGFAKIIAKTNMKAYLSNKDEGVSSLVGNLRDLVNYIGFVPQKNLVSEYLTVGEVVKFNLYQRHSFFVNISNVIVENLELSQYLKKYSNELSGGTLRRLSIAKTLFQGPPLILLDEPTSGLDTAISLQLITMLRRLTACGFSFLMTIHQPSQSIMDVIDEIYLFCLAKKKMKCIKVPKKEKVIDDILRTYSGNESNLGEPVNGFDDDGKKYEREERWRKVLLKLDRSDRSKQTNYFVKAYFLLARSILQELRNWKSLFVDFLCSFFLGLTFTIVFSSAKQFEGVSESIFEYCMSTRCADLTSNTEETCSSEVIQSMCAAPKYTVIFNLQFCLVFCVAFLAMASSLFWFSNEKQVIRREVRSGLALFPYYITKLLVKFPRCLLSVFCFLHIVFSGVCLNGSLFNYFLALFAVNCYVSGLGVVISLLYPKRDSSTEIVMIGIISVVVLMFLSSVFIPEMYFGNLTFVNLFFRYISFSFYSISQLFSIESGAYFAKYPKTVENMLKFYSFGFSYWNIIILCLYGFGFFTAGYIMLLTFYSNRLKNFVRLVAYIFSYFCSVFGCMKENASSFKLENMDEMTEG